jgi:hypothetical protein
MFVVIVINQVQQPVDVVLKVGHVVKVVRNCYLVNNIDVKKYSFFYLINEKYYHLFLRFVMLGNVYHVRRQVFDRVNVEKQKQYEIVMN